MRGFASELGYDVVARHWTSPIPRPEEITDETWERESGLIGLSGFDAGAHLAWLEELKPWLDEFRPPVRAEEAGPGQFHLENRSFEAVDADVLYAMVRRHRPARILEIGSGFSTLVLLEASRRNRQGRNVATVVSVDPQPPDFVVGLGDEVDMRVRSAAELPLDAFEGLGPGDILSIDSTHCVKVGGEVPYLMLEAIPRLRSGVLVHLHDIFLPWEYPRLWVEQLGYYFSEQYLLQALLAFNREFEVLFSSQVVARRSPQRLQELVPSFQPGRSLPASFWMRRGGGD